MRISLLPLLLALTHPLSAAPLGLAAIEPDSGLSDDDRITAQQNLIFYGQGAPQSQIELSLARGANPHQVIGSVGVGGNGSWSYDYSHVTLDEGVYELALSVMGGSERVVVSFEIDTTPPAAATITAIDGDSGEAGDWQTHDRSLIFSGEAAAGVEVTLSLNEREIGRAIASVQGEWQFDYRHSRLPVGPQQLQAAVTDRAGNVALAQRIVTILAQKEGDFALQFNASPIQGASFSPAFNQRFSRDSAVNSGNFSLLLSLFAGLNSSQDQWVIGNDSWRLQRNATTNRLSLISQHNTGERIVTSNDPLVPGVWHRVVVSCSNHCATAAIYIDGRLSVSITANNPSPLVVATTPLRLGNDESSGTANSLHGLIDELSLWSRPLSPHEALWYADKQLDVAEEGRLGYWRFDSYAEGDGRLVTLSHPDEDMAIELFAAAFANGVQLMAPQPIARSLLFDGVDDAVELGSSQIDLNGDFTVELWTRRNSATQRQQVLLEQGPLVANQVLQLDGIGAHLQVPPAVWFSGSFTVEAWVYPTATQNWGRLIDFGNGVGNNVIVGVSRFATGRPFLDIRLGQRGGNFIESSRALVNNRWQHLAVSYDAATQTGRIYIDGELVGQGSLPIPNAIVRNNNYVGRSNWTADRFYSGRMDELRIWSVARNQAAIRDNRFMTLAGSEPGLTLYYDFQADSPWSDRVNGTLAVLNNPSVLAPPLVSDNSQGVVNGRPLRLLFTAEGRLRCELGGRSVTTEEAIDGAWYHWSCRQRSVADGQSELTLLRGGQVVATAVGLAGSPAVAEGAQTQLGKGADGYFYHGWIDELRLWSEAKAEAELVYLQRNRPEANASALVAGWSFDELSGTTAANVVAGAPAAELKQMASTQLRPEGVELYTNPLLQMRGAAAATPLAGLWQGVIEVELVNQLHAQATASDVNQPLPTSAPFMLPILLHADASGQVHLLSEVTIMQRPLGMAGSGERVLITDQRRLPDYEGVIRRNGELVGLRLSAPAFVLEFDGQQVVAQHPLLGGLGEGGVVSGTLSYSADHPLHPLRHLYHPDLGREGRAPTVTRTLEITFTRASNHATTLHGRYREAVNGLHKATLLAEGEITLQRVSSVADLNP
jgi:hypothetical protein